MRRPPLSLLAYFTAAGSVSSGVVTATGSVADGSVVVSLPSPMRDITVSYTRLTLPTKA